MSIQFLTQCNSQIVLALLATGEAYVCDLRKQHRSRTELLETLADEMVEDEENAGQGNVRYVRIRRYTIMRYWLNLVLGWRLLVSTQQAKIYLWAPTQGTFLCSTRVQKLSVWPWVISYFDITKEDSRWLHVIKYLAQESWKAWISQDLEGGYLFIRSASCILHLHILIRRLVTNSSDRTLRQFILPTYSPLPADADPQNLPPFLDLELEPTHRFNDPINRTAWHAMCYSPDGDWLAGGTLVCLPWVSFLSLTACYRRSCWPCRP